MRLFGAVREIRPELCQPPAPPTATAGDKWRLDEVFVRIQGVLHYLWRGVAKRHLLADVEHRQSRYLNNRAENSHRPTLRRERQMQRFKSPEQAQDFLSADAFIHGHFRARLPNCLHVARTAGPLSLRKSAIVLKSGVNRLVSHITSTLLRLTLQASTRLDPVEVAIQIELQQRRLMVSWTAGCLGNNLLKAQYRQIEFLHSTLCHHGIAATALLTDYTNKDISEAYAGV